MINKFLLIVWLAQPLGNAIWLPVEVLGNPFAALSDCGAARARFEAASGGVGRYECIVIKVPEPFSP